MQSQQNWGFNAIDHVLLVRNVEFSRYFYCKVFGFTVARRTHSHNSNETTGCILDYPKRKQAQSVGMLRLVKCPASHLLLPTWNLLDDHTVFDLTLYVDNFNSFALDFEERMRDLNLELQSIDNENSLVIGFWCFDPDNYRICVLSSSF